jgi:hypothetical protein
MRYTRLPLFSLFSTVGALAVPMVAFAQSSQFFGPIIPQSGACTCPGSAPDWGCILQVLQNVINLGVALAIVAIVLSLVYAAFLLMTGGANPHTRLQGRRMVLNSVVGLAVVLLAWLSVDFVMKAIYNPRATFSGDVELGPWNSIWASDGTDRCLLVTNPLPLTQGNLSLITNPTVGVGQPGPAFGACVASNLQSAAAQAGISMSPAEANFFACVARPESGCGTRHQNYNWGRGSSAYGPFQILLGDNARFFENRACYAAAGVPGPLACSSGFRNGNPIPGREEIVARCQRAAANLACSTAAAHALFQAAGGPSPWTGNRDSTQKHQECRRMLGQ